jgi:hypothetical protein
MGFVSVFSSLSATSDVGGNHLMQSEGFPEISYVINHFLGQQGR